MHKHDFIVLCILLSVSLVSLFCDHHLVFLINHLTATALSYLLTVFKGTTVRGSNVILHQVFIKLTLQHRRTLEVVMNLHPNTDTSGTATAIILTRPIKSHVFVEHG